MVYNQPMRRELADYFSFFMRLNVEARWLASGIGWGAVKGDFLISGHVGFGWCGGYKLLGTGCEG